MLPPQRRFHITPSVSKTNNGFTIIEVALVLAIAGLIFLVVFIAWPALQNSQKDQARRQDVGKVVNAIESYKVDNLGDLLGSYPSNQDAVAWNIWGNNDGKLGNYVQNLNLQADGARQVWLALNVTDIGRRPGSTDGIDIYGGVSCDGNGLKLDQATSFAVITDLSGANRYFCASVN
ncbi:MAG: type II secretion system protein [Candidatus Nanoperiomorbaceae bacterium]